jgi:hypothetical protein
VTAWAPSRETHDRIQITPARQHDFSNAIPLRVALAHGQLELMLRMTIKTLAGLTVQEALDATRNLRNWELRKNIKKLFNDKTRDQHLRLKLQAILGKCEYLSQERNKLIHNTWGLDRDGSVLMQGDDHAWGPAPTPSDLADLASAISEVVNTLNQERLRGFIHRVCEAVEDDSEPATS